MAFRDLPEIPLPKRWREDLHTTIEQDISFKLLNGQAITTDEEKVFSDLASFYEAYDVKLNDLNFKTFTEDDLEKFRNYIFYVFNFIGSATNELRVPQTFRLVVNESVSGKNESITNASYLKAPSIEIVKRINRFNRANTPASSVFYSAENIDTTLKEIRPPLNKIVTVGVWVPKDKNKKLLSYPISHSDVALNINGGIQKATAAFEELGKYNSVHFMNYVRRLFKLLGREYTKPVQHHYEYLISASYAEQIFSEVDGNGRKFDCIVYPSVGNGYITENLAMRPDTLENHFYLERVIEFEVEREFYNRPYVSGHPYKISLAKPKNFRMTSRISGDVIYW